MKDMKNMNLLELNNVSLSIGTKILFQNLNLQLKKGEILNLWGKSASGKTLLLRSLLGIAPRDLTWSGDIFWQGEKIPNLHQFVSQRKVTYIPQLVSSLNPLMSIGDLFKKVRSLFPLPTPNFEEDKYFEKFSLKKDIMKMYPHQLSGGMAKRVLFALALLGSLENEKGSLSLVLADEPTLGLDEGLKSEMVSILKDLTKIEASVLLVSHEEEITKNFRRVILC